MQAVDSEEYLWNGHSIPFIVDNGVSTLTDEV